MTTLPALLAGLDPQCAGPTGGRVHESFGFAAPDHTCLIRPGAD